MPSRACSVQNKIAPGLAPARLLLRCGFLGLDSVGSPTCLHRRAVMCWTVRQNSGL